MFQYDFMQRAFVAIVCMACMSPILGLLLILRRQTLLADTLSHISLVGVALGLLWHVSPTWMTLVVVTIGAVVMEYLRYVYKNYSEISVAILMSTGLALAIFLMSFRQSGATLKIDQYLFGSLVTVSSDQLVVLVGLTLVVIGLYATFRRPLYLLLFDEDTAFSTGLPIRLLSVVTTVMIGLMISVLMPIAGTLLVASVLILPTSIAMRFAKNFKEVIFGAGLISFIGMNGGLYLSYEYSTPPGATITLIFVTILAIVQVFSVTLKWRSKRNQTKKTEN